MDEVLLPLLLLHLLLLPLPPPTSSPLPLHPRCAHGSLVVQNNPALWRSPLQPAVRCSTRSCSQLQRQRQAPRCSLIPSSISLTLSCLPHSSAASSSSGSDSAQTQNPKLLTPRPKPQTLTLNHQPQSPCLSLRSSLGFVIDGMFNGAAAGISNSNSSSSSSTIGFSGPKAGSRTYAAPPPGATGRTQTYVVGQA